MIRVPVGDLSAEDALAALEAAHHRVTVVPTIEELTEDSELKGYDTFGTVEQPGLGALMALGLPIQWSEELLRHRVGAGPGCGSRHEGGLRQKFAASATPKWPAWTKRVHWSDVGTVLFPYSSEERGLVGTACDDNG